MILMIKNPECFFIILENTNYDFFFRHKFFVCYSNSNLPHYPMFGVRHKKDSAELVESEWVYLFLELEEEREIKTKTKTNTNDNVTNDNAWIRT